MKLNENFIIHFVSWSSYDTNVTPWNHLNFFQMKRMSWLLDLSIGEISYQRKCVLCSSSIVKKMSRSAAKEERGRERERGETLGHLSDVWFHLDFLFSLIKRSISTDNITIIHLEHGIKRKKKTIYVFWYLERICCFRPDGIQRRDR